VSQLVLDDQLDLDVVLAPIRKWITVLRLQDLRLRQQILDDRVPAILQTLNQPTFVTIDRGFWQRSWCHPDYCILYFALHREQQKLLPGLLRALLRRPEFRSRAARMGKVARVGTLKVEYWQFQKADRQEFLWKAPR
jgi:hypothetical protein